MLDIHQDRKDVLMNKVFIAGIALLLTASIWAPCNAAGMEDRGKLPPKHDSNTLHKIGNAIQYPFRKAGENMSVNTHRAMGKNSVVKDKKHGSTEVVKPSGNTVVIAKDNPRLGWVSPDQHKRYMHRRHRNFTQEGSRYYWFEGHRYYKDVKTGKRVKID